MNAQAEEIDLGLVKSGRSQVLCAVEYVPSPCVYGGMTFHCSSDEIKGFLERHTHHLNTNQHVKGQILPSFNDCLSSIL
jgi:hypothetical protein